MTNSPNDTAVQEPPRRWLPILASIGPGLIVAGSIVGSGELIATTKTGAEAGMSLLWLIVLGCVVKVFVQIELGRYAITSGKPTLQALDEVPGPRVKGRGNWLVWYWMIMWLASISQLGGIVGAVGQSLALAVPITDAGKIAGEIQDQNIREQIASKGFDLDVAVASSEAAPPDLSVVEQAAPWINDVGIWAIVIAFVTSFMLYRGRYGLIQSLSTILVTSFTLLTVANLFLLQNQPDFAVTLKEFLSGFKFHLPPATEDAQPVRTALATFGIIGVGAAELIVYPYWCLEKGYAKFVGPKPNEDSSSTSMQEWIQRASGWLRVMRIDAWGSMVVYTFATIAFYLLGASILHPLGLNPKDDQLVRTLAVMYEPVFGSWTASVFLFGAFAVLYSTFFVANASHARTFADAVAVMGFIGKDKQSIERWIARFSALFPILCVVIYLIFPRPDALVLLSGVAQGVMLPMLGVAALFFRHRHSITGLSPGGWWDILLVISIIAMTITGGWTVIKEVTSYLAI